MMTPATLCDIDGFCRLSGEQYATAWLNLEIFRNECSPFSDLSQVKDTPVADSIVVDSYYGQAYDAAFFDNVRAVYGEATILPEYSGDELANYGFLRVPFRRVPRCLVRNRKELD